MKETDSLLADLDDPKTSQSDNIFHYMAKKYTYFIKEVKIDQEQPAIISLNSTSQFNNSDFLSVLNKYISFSTDPATNRYGCTRFSVRVVRTGAVW